MHTNYHQRLTTIVAGADFDRRSNDLGARASFDSGNSARSRVQFQHFARREFIGRRR